MQNLNSDSERNPYSVLQREGVCDGEMRVRKGQTPGWL